jgi:hypothetical protein
MCNHFVPEMTDVLQDIKMLSSHDVCFTKKEFDGGRDCICELESRFWLLGACPGSFGARSGPVCSATPHPLHSATHPGSPRRSPRLTQALTQAHPGAHPPIIGELTLPSPTAHPWLSHGSPIGHPPAHPPCPGIYSGISKVSVCRPPISHPG